MCSISVVIPLYNKEKFITRAIESIYAQTCKVDEIIVVDDGSTDNSKKIICEKFPLVTLITQPNGGVSSARNTGINHSKSEFIAFLDADDFWTPNFISNIKELIQIAPDAYMFCTNYAFLTSEKIIPANLKAVPDTPAELKNYFKSCIKANLPITSSSVCITKKSLKTIGCFPIGLKMGEDQAVWSQIACLGKVMFHPEISAYYDLSVSNSACDINKILTPAPQLIIYEKILTENKLSINQKKYLEKLMHFTVLSCIKNNLACGRNIAARNMILKNKNLKWDKYRLLSFLLTFLPFNLIKLLPQFKDKNN
ncbi:glycosyltransferase family A protein [Providencia manganoxydans]|uniref:glycosyltransferase family 2 protein n=1 Tax=Providencia manganoxydans TaxID=2923283 RepID=UPI0032D9FB03